MGCEDVQPREAYVVHGGSGRWPAGDGVTAISVPELMTRLLAPRA